MQYQNVTKINWKQLVRQWQWCSLFSLTEFIFSSTELFVKKKKFKSYISQKSIFGSYQFIRSNLSSAKREVCHEPRKFRILGSLKAWKINLQDLLLSQITPRKLTLIRLGFLKVALTPPLHISRITNPISI